MSEIGVLCYHCSDLQMLTIKLEEWDCFSAWIMGCNTHLETAAPDIKCTSHSSVLYMVTPYDNKHINPQ